MQEIDAAAASTSQAVTPDEPQHVARGRPRRTHPESAPSPRAPRTQAAKKTNELLQRPCRLRVDEEGSASTSSSSKRPRLPCGDGTGKVGCQCARLALAARVARSAALPLGADRRSAANEAVAAACASSSDAVQVGLLPVQAPLQPRVEPPALRRHGAEFGLLRRRTGSARRWRCRTPRCRAPSRGPSRGRTSASFGLRHEVRGHRGVAAGASTVQASSAQPPPVQRRSDRRRRAAAVRSIRQPAPGYSSQRPACSRRQSSPSSGSTDAVAVVAAVDVQAEAGTARQPEAVDDVRRARGQLAGSVVVARERSQ